METAPLLYEILIIQNRGSIRKVAEIAGVAYSTVHDCCSDKRSKAPNEILKAAFVVTKDPRLKKMLEPEGYKLVPDYEVIYSTKSPEAEITDIILASGAAIQNLRDVMADGDFSRHDQNLMLAALHKIEREVAEAKAAIRQMASAAQVANH